MNEFYFGKLIQDERKKQGITQEMLCMGLCEPPTLSRIESGKRQPSRELLIVLLQRLGITSDRYYGLNSFDELPKEDLKEEIKNSGARFERERRKAIDIYRQLLRYIDKHWLPCSETANFLPLLTYNYSRMLGHEKRFEEELEIVERGLAHCRRYGKSRMLGELLINKSCAQHELGQEPEGLENAKLAYHVLRAMEMNKQAEKVRQYVFDTYSQTNISQTP